MQADAEKSLDPDLTGLLNKDGAVQPEPGKRSPQFIAGISANILIMVIGTMLGWSSPSLAHLKAEGSHIPITSEEDSWISSLLTLSAGISPFAAGVAADKFGRKKSLLFAAIPVIIHYIMIAMAESVWVLYVARILAGFSVGWTFTVLPMYTGEIAETEYKGALGTLIQFSFSVGLLFIYALGPYVGFKILPLVCLAFPVLFLGTFFFVPESPYYLLQKGQEEEAKKALQWLRGRSAEGVAAELKIMKGEIEEAAQQKGGIKDLISSKVNMKSVGICIALMAFQQLAGINAVLFNAESIFKKSGGSITPALSAIILGVVMIAASIPTPILVEKLGRKILLIASAVGMGVSLTVLGVCFFLDEEGKDTSSISSLPIISVILFIIFYSAGFGPLPWAVMGEMYPANIKAIGATLTASFCWLGGFVVTRFFNDLLDLLDNSGTFWLFATCCGVAVLFVLFVVPETKGKSVAEIQLELS